MGGQKPLDIGGAIQGALELPYEEDRPGLDVTASGPRRTRGESEEKTDLDNSLALTTLRDACKGVVDGSLDEEAFYVTVSKIHQHITGVLAVFDLPQVQRELGLTDPEQRQLAESTHESLVRLEGGIAQLVQFLETNDPAELEQGMAIVEEAFAALDTAQDEALDISSEYEDSEEEE